MNPEEHKHLQTLAVRVREHIIRMATDGGCFIGASLSCTDLIVHLYSRVLRIDSGSIDEPTRDFFFLSKGHDVPALYGTLAELGYIDRLRLGDHLKTNDDLYWHPNRNIPGVEFHSGSLGHLLSVGIGVSLDNRLRRQSNRVFVMLGDGELDEGSVWEGCLVASAHHLDNLVAIVDRNAFQANLRTEDCIPLEPLDEKFSAFGWAVRRIDGHCFMQMEEVFRTLPLETGKPSVIIADTIRGKGLPSIEQRADRWFVNLAQDEIQSLVDELHGHTPAKLKSDVMHVR